MRIAVLVFMVVCQAISPVAGDHLLRGLVTDESGAVLPGVTVAASTADGRVLSSTVTDGAGRYRLGPLAAGQVTVTFKLDGFATATLAVAIGETDAVANQRLGLAPRSETVDVIGTIPVAPPPPPPVAPPRIRPRPVMWAVPDHDRESVCGPAKLESAPESLGSIVSRRYAANGLYGAGDELTVDGGFASGLEIGQSFVVRRTYQAAPDAPALLGEHSAGLVQIVAAGQQTAVAVVIYACDEILPGDRLAAFRPEPRRPVQPAGKADYRRAAKILFFDIGQIVGAPRRMAVIDLGDTSGVCAGQRVTLFHPREDGREPSTVGDGIVVAVRRESATIRIDHTIDAIFAGDLAAIQR
jgi:hypothetical protein